MDKASGKLEEVDARILKDGVVCHCFSPDLTSISLYFPIKHAIKYLFRNRSGKRRKPLS